MTERAEIMAVARDAKRIENTRCEINIHQKRKVGEVTMDREKVMSWLEGLSEPDWRVFHSDSEVQNIAKYALSLLKEQEPVKPKKGLFHMPTTILFDYECECGVPIMKGQPYCMSCGKAVKWDD